MNLQTVLDSVGVSIWQMALAPSNGDLIKTGLEPCHTGNGCLSYKSNVPDEHESSESEEDSDSPDPPKQSVLEYQQVAIGCDDGCVRIYAISGKDEFIYTKSLPRVSGEISSLELFGSLQLFSLLC